MWFIGVEVEQETSAPPPKKNPRSAPDFDPLLRTNQNGFRSGRSTVSQILTLRRLVTT